MRNKRSAQPEEDLVRLYLRDVGKYGLLTKGDEARLGQIVEDGNGVVEDRSAVSPLEAAVASLVPGEVAKLLLVLDDRERATPHLRPERTRPVLRLAAPRRRGGPDKVLPGHRKPPAN
ncbi:MAG: hypothetical protein J2P57_02505 [Acidimicrobiaceae bacterium]|nr:hypothetical protein [Acidimicrobiaceae bacterium]